MQHIEDELKAFKEVTDIVLGDCRFDESLESKINCRISKSSTRHIKLLPLALFSTACILLLVQIPSAKAFLAKNYVNVSGWIEKTTGIPIHIPEIWLTAEVADGETKHFYYELRSDVESASISIYQVEHPVPFNDRDKQLEMNGPLSESKRVGTVRVQKVNEYNQMPQFIVPSDAEAFDLTPSLVAYQKNNYTAVWFKQGGWSFEYVGNTNYTERRLREIPAEWTQLDFPSELSGHVKIFGGNRGRFYIYWEQAGSLFFVDVGDDTESILRIVKELWEWVPEQSL